MILSATKQPVRAKGKNSRRRGEEYKDVNNKVALRRWPGGGGGVSNCNNARLFVFSLIFIKLYIIEVEGGQIVRVREIFLEFTFA